MAMVINTNEQATRIRSVYNQNVSNMNAAMTRLATTRKINSAKDGAANWAISEKMRERMRANDQANQNIQNDTALLKTAQEGLGNTLNILETLKERAINSANDANISTDRLKIQEEVKQLVAQIDDNAAKVKFNDRALLNGAGETASTSKVSSNSSANAVTATGTYGNSAVYSFTGFNTKDGSALSANTKLVDLVTGDGEALFKTGDKITVSWTDNGAEKRDAIAVTDSTTLTAALAKFASTSDTAAAYTAADTALTAKDANDTTLSTTVAGYYFQGAAYHNISNVKFEVTNAAGETKEAAQAALEANPIQQSYGDPGKGTNTVYNIASTALSTTHASTDLAGTAITLANDDNTAFYLFGAPGTAGDAAKDLETTEYTLTINGKALTFTGNKTINQINDLLAEKGINVRMHYTATDNELLSYDGQEVTVGTYGGSATYKSVAGLNFISAPGEEIKTVKIEHDATATGSKFGATYDTSNANSVITSKLSLDKTPDLSAGTTTSRTSSDSLLPQGETLQFYVGGESNFGIDFSIGKATVQTLFNTTADNFAAMFKDKDGAEKALNLIDDAISKTLVEQTRLGAMEARLGYTSENLTSMNTNLEAAESAYRDADIAKEMNDYMKYSVLSQSSQYMLAQATQNPFSVLQLLQP